jgi:hypothetical protein
MLVRIEPCLPRLPIRQDAPHQFPEPMVVIPMPEMAEFVNHGVFQHGPRRKDEMPVQVHAAVGSATAPQVRPILDVDALRLQTVRFAVDANQG